MLRYYQLDSLVILTTLRSSLLIKISRNSPSQRGKDISNSLVIEAVPVTVRPCVFDTRFPKHQPSSIVTARHSLVRTSIDSDYGINDSMYKSLQKEKSASPGAQPPRSDACVSIETNKVLKCLMADVSLMIVLWAAVCLVPNPFSSTCDELYFTRRF
jgi:hypothetical protein